MCNIDDADYPQFGATDKRKARKPHKCCECGREIKPGEVYVRDFVIHDGDPSAYKVCAHCAQARRWLQEHCGGWVFQGVKRELEEHYEEGYREDGLQKLLIGMNRGWKSWRSDELLPVPEIFSPEAEFAFHG